MPNSTKIRPLGRIIDRTATPMWVIDSEGRLAFLSGAAGSWLGIEPELLIGRLSVAGASISDDPLDHLAASLSPPPGFATRGTAAMLIQPAAIRRASERGQTERAAAKDTRFVRLGQADLAITLAIAGDYGDDAVDHDVDAAILLRTQLDSWRRHHVGVAETSLGGSSRLAKRTQRQVRMASQQRIQINIATPAGCFAESIAMTIHHRSAPDEPVSTIDGPLMDAELLDASVAGLVSHLGRDDQSMATAILKQADETPAEAQNRLADWLDQFDGRLRIIAITKPSTPGSESANGVELRLADWMCGFTISLSALTQRVEDIPMLATAMLDRRRAAGDGAADRINRAALDAMVIYPWPENLNELDQSIRHAIRKCTGDVISLEHLPLAIRSFHPGETVPAAEQTIELDRVVAEYELELIRQTLEATDGNRAEAARRLGISRTRLLRKLDGMSKENAGQEER